MFERGGSENQWVVWDHLSETYVPRSTNIEQGGVPAWIPRCVTNLLTVKIAGIAAILNQSDPAQMWAPATDDDADKATAEVCQDAVPVLLEEIDWKTLRLAVHRLICLTDKAAVCVYYDTDPKYGEAPIQAARCEDCSAVFTPMALEDADGACPACGSTMVGPAIDPMTGVPISETYPKGKLCAEVLTAGEFSLPPSATTIDTRKLPYVMLHSRFPEAEAMKYWGQSPAGRSAIKGASGTSAQASGLYRQLADTIRTVSGPRSVRGADDHAGPVVYRLQHDPIQDDEFDFPEGLYVVVIGDTVVEAGPLPFHDDNGHPVKSVLVRAFYPVPGSQFGHPPADDLVPLIVTRNTVETLLLCILLHLASPREYLPDTVTLLDQSTGVPGQTIRYSSTNGDRPVIAPGTNPPEGLYKYLELLDQKIEEVSRLNAILAGQRPEGDPTLGEVQRLEERGMASFSEPLVHLIEFEKQLARLCLWIAKDSGWAPRFRSVRGENGAWEVSQFMAADLTGLVDVQVAPSSAWPKSPMLQVLRFEKAIALGVLPPPATDPEIQTKAISLFSLEQLKPSMDIDYKRVARKIDRWKQATDPREIEPPDPVVDNLPVHEFLVTLFLKTEEADAMRVERPDVYAAIRLHLQALQQLKAMANAPPPPPGGPPEGAQPPQEPDGSAVSAAVESGALIPKGAGGDPLQAALDAGVLTPAPQVLRPM